MLLFNKKHKKFTLWNFKILNIKIRKIPVFEGSNATAVICRFSICEYLLALMWNLPVGEYGERPV